MIVKLATRSHVAEARRRAMEEARRRSFSGDEAVRVANMAAELATNLLEHASGGELAIARFDDADGIGIELLALDRGDGLAGIGTGLGAVMRLPDCLRVYSRPGLGTAVMARFAAKVPQGEAARRGPQIGAVAAPYPGEEVCGDAWAVDSADGGTLLVADGTGHGPLAARAAQAAIGILRRDAGQPLPRLLETIHRALALTRGAAVAMARVDRAAGLVRFTGIGNISGTLAAGGRVHRMASHNGTAGHVARRITEFTYPYEGAPTLILHSDGLTTRWEIDAYPGLVQAHPSLIAGVLYRDHQRGRDDATVVVMKAAA